MSVYFCVKPTFFAANGFFCFNPNPTAETHGIVMGCWLLVIKLVGYNPQSPIPTHQSPIPTHQSSIIIHQSSINHPSSVIRHQSKIENRKSSITNPRSPIIFFSPRLPLLPKPSFLSLKNQVHVMAIRENLLQIKETFKDPHCLLVAVSKTKPVEDLQEAYDAGIRDFGENKVQEMVDKQPLLPADIRWHMIGHLQRNKVKYIAPFVHLIHGVDSFKLLKAINKEGAKIGRVISCMLQVHIAKEESKFGFDEQELREMIEGDELAGLEHVKIKGLMGMATFTEDRQVIRAEFGGLKSLMGQLNGMPLPANVELKELSMGMSGDYLIAQEEGSTMVRIGSAIFGERNY